MTTAQHDLLMVLGAITFLFVDMGFMIYLLMHWTYDLPVFPSIRELFRPKSPSNPFTRS